MLHNPAGWLRRAKQLGVAVPALNFHNLEVLQGILLAASDERSPVILQTSPGSAKYMGIGYAAACARTGAQELGVAAALQIDHCLQFDMLVKCLRAGYTALMVETGHLGYDENVAFMRRVVEMAHAADVCVEGELGRIGGTEDDMTHEQQALTVPQEAARYVADTGVDYLAVAIGTAHGVYKGEPHVDLARLSDIAALIDLPLVLHGASGVPDETVRRAIGLGIAKVNVATDLKIPLAQAIKDVFAKDAGEDDPRVYMGAGREAVRAAARQKIRLCGATNLVDRL